MEITVELDDRGKRLVVEFPYDHRLVGLIKLVPGARFVPRERGGPHWTVPAELGTARALRFNFGKDMILGPKAIAWGKEQTARERNLLSVAGADDADLKRLPESNPEMFEFISGRPFQRADVAHMAQTNAINANQPSLGKTVETIAAIWEAGMEDGAHLVCVPVTAIETVWVPAIEEHDGAEALIYQGPERAYAMMRAKQLLESGDPFYMVTNPATVLRDIDELTSIPWSTFTIDEFHKSGLPNVKTKFYEAAKAIKSERRWALSGTPIGGKPDRLYGALSWIEPNRFTSRWRWIEQWLVIEQSNFGKKIGGIQRGKEQDFYEALRPYLIRRTKKEVRKDLPEQVHIEVLCSMTKPQAKLYKQMATETEVRIDEEHLSAANVLALYTRLKQFANAKCRIEAGKVLPTFESGKLPQLLERLEERGISAEPEGDTQVLIGTQFKQWAYTIEAYLKSEGITSVGVISGDTKQKDRLAMAGPKGLFQTGDLRVLILVTTAGGVALNLDNAESIHIMDETWNPDDQEQLADRGHRFTGLTVYTYRSKQTIEQYIQDINIDKDIINKSILDLRRQGIVHA